MKILSVFLAIAATVHATDNHAVSAFGKLQSILKTQKQHDEVHQAKLDLSKRYPAHIFSVPIDHFHNDSRYEPHTSDSYDMRYWFDATYYKKGGPVIVLAAGETDAGDRLPFLYKGIVHELAMATGGIGVILEHRYYGRSLPTSNFSTESMRFCTTDQALADTAIFAQNVVFPGLEHHNLTASTTPWIAYGGSYAGAFVSFLRKLYPETFFGAISSSGVTEVIVDYWQYNMPIIEYGPEKCVRTTRLLTNVIDNILTIPNNAKLIPKLQDTFGLGNVAHPQDFVAILYEIGIGTWQGRNWDPAVGSPRFMDYCGEMEVDKDIYNLSDSKGSAVEEILAAAGYGKQVDTLKIPMLNMIGWTQKYAVKPCAATGHSQDQCFTTFDDSFWEQDDLSATWRLWAYQVCTEWAYFQTGSGMPVEELPIISRTVDMEYSFKMCKQMFNITTLPDPDYWNKQGGFKFSYPRLAQVVGEEDVWRPATPLADEAKPWPKSTSSEPFILIDGAGHHWDENGLFPNETSADLPPKPIVETQRQEIVFVLEWLKETKGVNAPSLASDEQYVIRKINEH